MSTRLAQMAAALVLAGTIAFGQSANGTITGTIADPGGAVVAGAMIEVKNTDTGVVSRGGTSNTGNYVLSVPSGTYEITVTVAGFKKYVQSNVQVVTSTDTRRDVVLEVGSATESVTVADTAPLLKTESGEMSHTVSIQDVDNLPVLTVGGGTWNGATASGNIRNPLQSTLILPGVSFANDAQFVVNGLPSNSETIRIDGQDSTANIWKVLQQRGQSTAVDAIQEVQVQTSNFSAEYGQVAGGYINYTIKSGTNTLHGSGYDYFVNEALNAGSPFTDAGLTNSLKEGQHVRNTLRRNDFGGTVGGPIRIPKIYNGTNKTFFFFNFEQYRENRAVTNGLMSVPTAAYRSGDFGTAGCFKYAGSSCAAPTQALTIGGAAAIDPAGTNLTYGQIFDPNTTRVVNGAQVRSPFPNNTIPLTRFDAVAAAMQNMLPLPNLPGIVNNYQIPAYTNFFHTTNWAFKLDHAVSATTKLSWYFTKTEQNTPNATGLDPKTYPFTTQIPLGLRNWTTRVNYDQSIRPTLLLHIGVGFYHQMEPTVPPAFDSTKVGLKGYYDESLFPTIYGLGNPNTGAWACSSTGLPCGTPNNFGNINGLGGFYKAIIWEEKPTAVASLTWVKGNHIFKYGGEYTGEGYIDHSNWRANGYFLFSANETADPWVNGQALNFPNASSPGSPAIGGSGFNYASFLLGLPDQSQLSTLTQTRLGSHFMGLYAQDSWKITKKLTLDYGLRYDYQTYIHEQHGREQIESFSTPNPTVGGLLGAGIYEGYGGGRCDCEFSHVYPYSFGPRVGVAFQINTKTVLRAGAGISYGVMHTPNGLSYGVGDYYVFNPQGFGISPLPNGLQGGNPYPNLTWPNFSPGKYPVAAGGQLPPSNPGAFFNPTARAPRIGQWSVGIQRELSKDMVAEVSYVGNTEVWGVATFMDQYSYNPITNATLAHYGLSLANAADRALLTSQIGSPQAAARGFYPAYPGMPTSQLVAQQLRPVPQWTTTQPTLGPFVGKSWYDAMQAKLTKRFSHGLQAQASYVWSKATDIGLGTEAGNINTLQGEAVVGDIFNYGTNKQLNQLTRPQAFVISGAYSTPKFQADSTGMKVLSQAVRDWQIGFLLRYQNGALIESPASQNQLNLMLERYYPTFQNYVPGVNPLAVDPNCGCFNPQTAQVLNPKAWTDAPAGTWGVSAPFYNNYRWQRQPAESMSLGRNFRMGKENRYNLSIRAEFQNIFNRLFLAPPVTNGNGGAVSANLPLTSVGGVNVAGYGSVATLGGGAATPRSGQLVGRFTF
jgi:hypothetical protein